MTKRTEEVSKQGPSRTSPPGVSRSAILRFGEKDQKVLGTLQTSGAEGVETWQYPWHAAFVLER